MEPEREPVARIDTLDILRGVGVMGILAMNIVAFAMPFEAYMNPLAYGTRSSADLLSWAISFVFVDGKMRGLFSFLFGASMLLVIERAEARGDMAAEVHFRRMVWLLAFGLVHFYFIWFGDILTAYALVGMVAWFFRHLSTRRLILAGTLLVLVQTALFGLLAHEFYQSSAAASAANASPQAIRDWQELQRGFGIPSPGRVRDILAMYRSGWLDISEHKLSEKLTEPITSVLFFGWETLGYMLFGMAGLKSGFLGGRWSDAAYRRVALMCLGLSVPAYGVLAHLLWSRNFDTASVAAVNLLATTPVRPVMVYGYAALIVLATRRGGAVVDRIAAAGRAAFTNYLGTSILMTFVFYGWGLGLFGTLNRLALWPFVIGAWALMLLWSKPWLDRFRYGPLEWLWRTLARGEPQPMRGRAGGA